MPPVSIASSLVLQARPCSREDFGLWAYRWSGQQYLASSPIIKRSLRYSSTILLSAEEEGRRRRWEEREGEEEGSQGIIGGPRASGSRSVQPCG